MIETDFTPKGVCARNIHVVLSDDGKTIESVEFTNGCNGNLKAISKLVKGAPVDEIVGKIAGTTCGNRPTSCADQLSIALREAQALANE